MYCPPARGSRKSEARRRRTTTPTTGRCDVGSANSPEPQDGCRRGRGVLNLRYRDGQDGTALHVGKQDSLPALHYHIEIAGPSDIDRLGDLDVISSLQRREYRCIRGAYQPCIEDAVGISVGNFFLLPYMGPTVTIQNFPNSANLDSVQFSKLCLRQPLGLYIPDSRLSQLG
jgi:hypothetical protein